MENYLASLIGLFGSISGITIAFLVLLYDSSKKWKTASKEEMIFEIENTLKCYEIPNVSNFVKGNELFDTLQSDSKHKQVNEENVLKLIEELKTIIAKLRSQNVENRTDEQVGKDFKKSYHIEKYHLKDILNAYSTFTSANTFYINFPNLVKLSIGIPLLITFILLLIAEFSSRLICLVGAGGVDGIIICLVLFGLAFVYFNSVRSLSQLTKIDQ